MFCNVILINFNRHAYYFLKYISYNNQCDKSSNCHLWSINRNNIFSETVLEPTLNELAILGGIVVLRTILSVFLNREIKDLEAESEKDQ